MLIFKRQKDGDLHIERIEEPPDNFDSPGWKRYNDLCEESERTGASFTEEMRRPMPTTTKRVNAVSSKEER